MSDARPLDELLAYEQIRQLAARYAVSIDRRDIDALVALFVPDVRLGPRRSGHAALRDDFTAQLRAIGPSVLSVTTHQIDLIDEKSASGHVYCTAEIDDLAGRWIRQAIRYDDTYARRDGRWLFVTRRHRLFYGVEMPVNPQTLAPANWPENHDGLGTLPFADDSWVRFAREGSDIGG